MLAACSREPAAVKDLQLLSRALSKPHEYLDVAAELEKDAEGARRALAEQSAQAGTHREFMLWLLEDRLAEPGRYAAWEDQLPRPREPLTDLVHDRHFGFWSEKLLFGAGGDAAFAARHLVAIDTKRARRALELRVVDTTRDPDQSSRIAAEGLAREREVAPLISALSAWYDASHLSAATRARAIEQLRVAGRQLAGPGGDGIERQLLSMLEDPKSKAAHGQASLVLLESVVRPETFPRLAQLRRSLRPELRADMDLVLIAALARDPHLSRIADPRAAAGGKERSR